MSDICLHDRWRELMPDAGSTGRVFRCDRCGMVLRTEPDFAPENLAIRMQLHRIEAKADLVLERLERTKPKGE